MTAILVKRVIVFSSMVLLPIPAVLGFRYLYKNHTWVAMLIIAAACLLVVYAVTSGEEIE